MASQATKTYTCGLDAAVDVIGGKRKALILWEPHAGVRRPAGAAETTAP